MSKKVIKLKESDIQHIVENIVADTNQFTEQDETPVDDGEMSDGYSCSSKYVLGKDEEGHYYIIDLMNNNIIAKK